MTTGSDAGDRSAAWDRIGMTLEDMNALQNNVTKRTLDLWNDVAQSVSSEKYGADAMAKDAARVMTAGMKNLDDFWTFLTRPTQREHVADVLPTAFLHVQWTEDAQSPISAEPVLIRVQGLKMDELPWHAEIGVTGPVAAEAEKLRGRLKATLVKGKPAYSLEMVGAGGEGLTPGTYGGLVYLPGTQRALADLRIVVDQR